MKKFITYVLGLIVMAGLSGCNPYDVEEILISREDVSLTIKGEPLNDHLTLSASDELNTLSGMIVPFLNEPSSVLDASPK